MENIKISVFDLFTYFLPGAVVLVAGIILLSPWITSLTDLSLVFKDISVSLGIVFVIFSYIIGTVIDYPASFANKQIGWKIWGNPNLKVTKSTPLTKSQQRVLVRHYSKENYAITETWSLIQSMSRNLAFAFLIVLIVALIQLVKFPAFEWLFLSVLSLVSIIILLKRARDYDYYCSRTLVHVTEVLYLVERARNDAKITEKKSDGTSDVEYKPS